MLVLNPNETYTVNRILKDWADNTTYYVQAKVYRADTRTLLETLNLTDNGNRWFSKSYRVPADTVYGRGTHLIIITSVYTDSGYTSKSQNHYDEPEEVLIQQRWNPAINMGGGDGGWDYKVLLKEIKLLLEENRLTEEPPETSIAPTVPERPIEERLEPVVERIVSNHVASTLVPAINSLANQIANLPKPIQPEPIDFAPITSSIAAVRKEISALPKPEKLDLNPILIEIGRLFAILKTYIEHMTAEQVAKIDGLATKEIKVSLNPIDGGLADRKARVLTRLKRKYAISH